MHYNALTTFYKSHVIEIQLVISYEILYTEHEFDSHNNKIVSSFFCNYNLKEMNIYIMKCTLILIVLRLIPIQISIFRLLLRFLRLSLVQLFGNVSGVSSSIQQAFKWTIFHFIFFPWLRYIYKTVFHVHH